MFNVLTSVFHSVLLIIGERFNTKSTWDRSKNGVDYINFGIGKWPLT